MIVGTAGHVDHGKTALVRALTGVETDRLQEEERRGITIDLGFAYMPGLDGTTIGFVDVPGHEDLVRTMVAGVSGIDLSLLVVAADEGVKPQTREHVEILRLLDLDHGLVVITKSDRVDDTRRAQVLAEVAALLKGGRLARTQPLFVSTVTGEGLDEVRRRLLSETRTRDPRIDEKVFRLAIDRSFTLKGVGTIIAGAVVGGRVKVDDIVTIMPSRTRCRVRSIHVNNQPSLTGVAGDRCALALVGVARDAAPRGAWICGDDEPFESARIDVALHVCASEMRALRSQTPVHFHCGASDVPGRVSPLDAATLQPGADGFAQLALARPLPLRHDDRFVLRDTSGRRTIGGGKVLDVRPPTRKRRSPERLARLAILREVDPQTALLGLLDHPPGYEMIEAFATDHGLAKDQAGRLAERLGLFAFGSQATCFVMTAAAADGCLRNVVEVLTQIHAAHPDMPGLATERLRTSIELRLPNALFAHVVSRLLETRRVAQTRQWLHLPGHVARLNTEDQRIADLMMPLIETHRFRPPRVRDLGVALAFHENHVRRACKALVRSRALVEIAHDHFFTRDTVVEMANIAEDLTASTGAEWFAAADFRDRLDNGRKVAIQILEYFDRRGMTRRSGDWRRLVRKPETDVTDF